MARVCIPSMLNRILLLLLSMPRVTSRPPHNTLSSNTLNKLNIAVCFVGQFLREGNLGQNIRSHFDAGFSNPSKSYHAFISTSTQHYEEKLDHLVNFSALCDHFVSKGFESCTVDAVPYNGREFVNITNKLDFQIKNGQYPHRIVSWLSTISRCTSIVKKTQQNDLITNNAFDNNSWSTNRSNDNSSAQLSQFQTSTIRFTSSSSSSYVADDISKIQFSYLIFTRLDLINRVQFLPTMANVFNSEPYSMIGDDGVDIVNDRIFLGPISMMLLLENLYNDTKYQFETIDPKDTNNMILTPEMFIYRFMRKKFPKNTNFVNWKNYITITKFQRYDLKYNPDFGTTLQETLNLNETYKSKDCSELTQLGFSARKVCLSMSAKKSKSTKPSSNHQKKQNNINNGKTSPQKKQINNKKRSGH